MSLPFDIPNPDQENVYYSLASLKTELLNWFEPDKISVITEKYKDYYLPTFVFDIEGAPNRFCLDVWPRGLPKESIQLDQVGSIVDRIVVPKYPVKKSKTRDLKDSAFNCTLDPKFYVDTILKEPSDREDPLDGEQLDPPQVDLILATKWYQDPNLQEKLLNFEIIKNLLREQLKIVPPEEFEGIRKKYEETLSLIDSFEATLETIGSGQEATIDSLRYGGFFKKVYESIGDLQYTDRQTLDGTRIIMAQALSDLGNIWKGVPLKNIYQQRIPLNRNDNTEYVVVGEYMPMTNAEEGYTIWPYFLDTLENVYSDWSPSIQIDAPLEARTFLDLRDRSQDFVNITEYDGVQDCVKSRLLLQLPWLA